MKHALRLTAAALSACTLLVSCDPPGLPYDITKFQDTTARKEFNTNLDLDRTAKNVLQAPADFSWTGEAEDAKCVGKVSEMNVEFPGFTGDSYVGNFTSPADQIVFTVEIPADGVYNLAFNTCVGYSESEKHNPVLVDGEQVGSIVTPMGKEFTASKLDGVYLSAGTHEIAAGTEWGYYFVDNLTVTAGTPISESVYEVTGSLCDPDAFDNSKRLYQFLKDCYGKYTITGQFCDTGKFGKEMTLIHDETGYYPAMLGLDMSEYTPSRVEKGASGQSVDYAKDFYINNGGIVTMCWHWNAPTKYLLDTAEQPWYKGFYAEATNISLDAIADGSDPEGKDLLMADIDAICQAMEPLKEAQVPILWRPLHEAAGGWFWWGKCKPESYLWLWNTLYDKMVNQYGLHNLIWVWNGQEKAWYPGDDTVDIIGIDIYADAHTYTSQSSTFADMITWTETNKIIALTENGVMPDPDLLQRDRAVWSWFATWSGDFIHKFGLPVEDYTEFSMWDKVYQSEHTLTLEELPCLWDYPIKEAAE